MTATIGRHVTVRCWPHGPSPFGGGARMALGGPGRSACITLAACQPVTYDAHRAIADAAVEIGRRLAALGAAAAVATPCGHDPADCACIAPTDRHVLVLVIGAAPLHPTAERWARDAIARHGDDAVVLCALTSRVTHAAVFGGGAHALLARRTAVAWHDDPVRLADVALTAAIGDERPGVFVSYVRDDATPAADAIHDALTHAGFRVFVDRFAGTPGRHFPGELREAMADMGFVLVLETPTLPRSVWTNREASFAWRYRIGPVAVRFHGAPMLARVRWRLAVPDRASLLPAPATVARIVDFVRDRQLAMAAYRRAYFETLIDAAARHGAGTVSLGDDVLTIERPVGTVRARALVSARPGQLRHVHRLVDATTGRPVAPLLLAGEHDHLAPGDARDLRWLAAHHAVTLAGSASLYRTIRRLL